MGVFYRALTANGLRTKYTDMARNQLATDPGFPASLPLAYVLKSVPLEAFLEIHGYSLAQWDLISSHKMFKAAVAEAEKLVAEEGGGFKMKARAMAEQSLPEMQALINNNDVPPAVRADLIKAIIKVAGLDGSVDQRSAKPVGNAVSINIDLG